MATVHIPKYDELSQEKREPVERLAQREGVAADELSLSYRAKVHWPEYLEASSNELRYNFKALRTLPEMTKEGIHVAVSMVNKCDF